MTPFNFATMDSKGNCAKCHPGGGSLEYDRQGRRYDVTLAADPGLAESFSGDYHKSPWDKSGVMEADCLMCHKVGFDNTARFGQLKAWNIAWAGLVGAGLGTVTGSVKDGETPTVVYDKTQFDADGKYVGGINGSVKDKNCLACHKGADAKKRGKVWADGEADVHRAAGLTCVTCHPSDDKHNFAKGDAIISSVRNDLDGTVDTCAECHESGNMGAPTPAHTSVVPGHLDKIACETCHISAKNYSGLKVVDTIMGGKKIVYTTVDGVKTFAKPGEWTPDYVKRDDGKVYPANYVHVVWWGNKTGDLIEPYYGKEIKKAFAIVKDKIGDDNGDGMPEVNTDAEIIAMTEAYKEVLDGNKRFDAINPVYSMGGELYYVDASGTVVTEEHHIAEIHTFSLSHNVAPASEALTCDGCHTDDNHIFGNMVLVTPFDENGEKVYKPNYELLGY